MRGVAGRLEGARTDEVALIRPKPLDTPVTGFDLALQGHQRVPPSARST